MWLFSYCKLQADFFDGFNVKYRIARPTTAYVAFATCGKNILLHNQIQCDCLGIFNNSMKYLSKWSFTKMKKILIIHLRLLCHSSSRCWKSLIIPSSSGYQHLLLQPFWNENLSKHWRNHYQNHVGALHNLTFAENVNGQIYEKFGFSSHTEWTVR